MTQTNKTSLDDKAQVSLDVVVDEDLSAGLSAKDEILNINKSLPYHTRLNPPKKVYQISNKSTRVQESPLEARSPQEVLDYHGMYRDPSIYKENPTKIYADLTAFQDFETMLKGQIAAERKFKELPIDVRAKFNHDVSQFANYVASDKFDVNEILDDDGRIALKAHQDGLKAKQEHEAYLQSPEYQEFLKEQKLLSQYRKEQYEAWKASKNIK